MMTEVLQICCKVVAYQWLNSAQGIMYALLHIVACSIYKARKPMIF